MRKAGHSSIVAPLAATLAATVAVGVGVGMALARAERERRALRERRLRDRRFARLEDEPLGTGLQRMTLGQLDIAIEALTGEGKQISPQERVHEVRKSLKRLRALLRLVQDDLGERAYARETELLRDAGVRLARARDAEVLLSTLDGLIAAHPNQLGGRRGVQRLRARLQTECDGAPELALADSATHAGVLEELCGLRARVAEWELADPGGIEAIEPALKRLYGKGRRRLRRAERGSGKSGRRLHEWRKRVKDLRYAAEMLERAEDGGKGGRSGAKKSSSKGKRGKRKSRGETPYIGKLARAADDLGELLGEEHDLAVLSARVREEAKATRASGAPSPGTRKLLLKLIAKRRRKLRKRALRDGRRLYGGSPKRFVRRVRSAAALGSVSRR